MILVYFVTVILYNLGYSFYSSIDSSVGGGYLDWEEALRGTKSWLLA